VDVDGEFGARTRRALTAFQRAHGLASDGVVGQGTWGALVTHGRQRSPARC
jgi:zinc D-Ala-D-Ala carboxypeptidase